MWALALLKCLKISAKQKSANHADFYLTKVTN
jgi:hypothetical protein